MSEIQDQKEVVNRVLFVDDEPIILSALRRGLVHEKYLKFYATSGQEALALMAQQEIHVVVTDMRMPGMSGLDLLKAITEKYPDVIKMVLSGYTQLPQVLATINQVEIFKFIPKPWNMEEEFIPMVREALRIYNMTREYNHMKEVLEKQNLFYQKTLKQLEDKNRLARSDFEALVRFHEEATAQIAALLQNSASEKLAPAEIGARVSTFGEVLRMIDSAFPLERATFSADKMRSDLSLLILSARPSEERDSHTYVGKPRPLEKQAPYPIKHGLDKLNLAGPYKFFMLLQKLILTKLLKLDHSEQLGVSLVYSPENQVLLIEYECPAALVSTSPWTFQTLLFALQKCHGLLSGKFDLKNESGKLTLLSTCHFEKTS